MLVLPARKKLCREGESAQEAAPFSHFRKRDGARRYDVRA